MNNQLRNPKHGMLHLILAISWLLLGIWEIADDGHSVRAWIYIVTAVAWLVVSIYNMNYKKKDYTMKKIFTKEVISFALASFIIWSIIEIVIDLITGVTLAEMLSVKYIVCYLAGALGFALVFTLVFKVLNLFPDKKKK